MYPDPLSQPRLPDRWSLGSDQWPSTSFSVSHIPSTCSGGSGFGTRALAGEGSLKPDINALLAFISKEIIA